MKIVADSRRVAVCGPRKQKRCSRARIGVLVDQGLECSQGLTSELPRYAAGVVAC